MRHRRRGTYLLFGCALALSPAACAGGNCLAACLDGTITFQLSTPLQGQGVAVTVEPPSSSPLTIECGPADGSVGCTPQSSALRPHFDGPGSLESVEGPIFGTGQYHIQIAVDGAAVIDETFRFDDVRVAGLCGSSCYRNARFTIQN